MVGHGELYSTTRLWQVGAKGGSGEMRARYFSCCKRGKEKGGCGRMACSLVALDSFVSGSRGHSGAVRCSSFLGEEER